MEAKQREEDRGEVGPACDGGIAGLPERVEFRLEEGESGDVIAAPDEPGANRKTALDWRPVARIEPRQRRQAQREPRRADLPQPLRRVRDARLDCAWNAARHTAHE